MSSPLNKAGCPQEIVSVGCARRALACRALFSAPSLWRDLAALVLLLALCVIPMQRLSAQSETDQAIDAAMQALDEFMETFNARDPVAWAGTLNYPHVRFASGTVTVWESAEEFARGGTFERLPRTGWDHSAWLSREVALASPAKVHINTEFARYNSDDEIIGTYQSLYIVTLQDGHWGTQARSSLAP